MIDPLDSFKLALGALDFGRQAYETALQNGIGTANFPITPLYSLAAGTYYLINLDRTPVRSLTGERVPNPAWWSAVAIPVMEVTYGGAVVRLCRAASTLAEAIKMIEATRDNGGMIPPEILMKLGRG